MGAAAPWWSQRWVWWSAAIISVAALVTALGLAIGTSNAAVAYVIASACWIPFGILLWAKRPEHPMGPLITIVGFLSLSVVPGFLMGGIFEQFEATVSPRPWPMIIGLAASGAYTYLFLVVIAIFPDGKPLGRPQRWLVWTLLVMGVAATVLGFLSEPLGPTSHPLVTEQVGETARGMYDLFVQAFGVGLIVVVGFKVADFRRAESVRHAQLKWLIYVLAIYLVVTMISFGIIGTDHFNVYGLVVDALFTGLIPLSMAIAILRYRLYEIDRLVSRTLTYALVALTVTAVFALPVVFLSTRLGGASNLVIAGATLAAAAVFNPARKAIQRRVDHRFNRARYDAAREIDELASRLRAAPDVDTAVGETVGIVQRVLAPSTLSIWLRG